MTTSCCSSRTGSRRGTSRSPLARQAVLDVTVGEDLREPASACMLTDDVCSNAILHARPGEEEGEWTAQQARESLHFRRLYPSPVRRKSTAGRFAERVLIGVDDTGAEERVVIWIERKPGALWAVGRAVNPHLRSSDEPRHDD